MNFLDRWQGPLLSVLRIVAALLFIAHGTSKLFAFPGLAPMATGAGASTELHGRSRDA